MKIRKFYTKHQDKIELTKAYVGSIFFLLWGVAGFPLPQIIIEVMKK